MVTKKGNSHVSSLCMSYKLSISVYDVVIDGFPSTPVNDKTLQQGYGAFFAGVQMEGGQEISFLQCGISLLPSNFNLKGLCIYPALEMPGASFREVIGLPMDTKLTFQAVQNAVECLQ